MPEENPSNRKLALIVDDDTTNLMVLAQFLKKLDFDVVQAENGKEAIEQFSNCSPDIIFMDIMMPVMNGFEATKQIKYLCKSNFIPVIFLTALNDSEDLANCINAGGDDYLSKPLDMTMLRAKIYAMERIRDLYRNVQRLNKSLQDANELANTVFELAVFNNNINIDAIETWFTSAEIFNSDLFLISHTPSNGLNILFGHFNVPGLASAVGALPTSETFRSMTKKGFSPHSIVEEINAKLYDLLPNGIALSLVFLNIDVNIKQASVCNFNMADVYFVSETSENIIHKITGKNDAIGQSPRYSKNITLERIEIDSTTRIILSNKNAVLCKNISGEEFGIENFERSLNNGIVNGNILGTLQQEILDFNDADKKLENLGLIEIPCTKSLVSNENIVEKEIELRKNEEKRGGNTSNYNHKIKFQLHVDGSCMKSIDPIPTLLNNIESIVNIEKQQEALFTILTELYVNALDHGLLKLSSHIKQTESGFVQYFKEKDKALEELDSGYINFNLSLEFNNEYNRIHISVEDSGPGFDTNNIGEATISSNTFYGRGIMLIKGLCEEFGYNESGNQVYAIYRWKV